MALVIKGNWPSYDSFLMTLNQPSLAVGKSAQAVISVYPNPFTKTDVFDITGKLLITDNGGTTKFTAVSGQKR
jgi:hypothetical protein